MTVVLEDQVKTITAEIYEQFGCGYRESSATYFGNLVDIESIVRAVIAMYDISDIARLELPQVPYYNADPPNDLSAGPIK